jgi:hypothetical protein
LGVTRGPFSQLSPFAIAFITTLMIGNAQTGLEVEMTLQKRIAALRTAVLVVVTAITTLSFASVAAAPDVSGVWILTLGTGADAPIFVVTLKQEDQKLTGTCSTDATDDEFTVSGQVKDDAVTWRCTSRGLVADFSGTVDSSATEMTGSWSTPAPAKGIFTAQKQR